VDSCRSTNAKVVDRSADQGQAIVVDRSADQGQLASETLQSTSATVGLLRTRLPSDAEGMHVDLAVFSFQGIGQQHGGRTR